MPEGKNSAQQNDESHVGDDLDQLSPWKSLYLYHDQTIFLPIKLTWAASEYMIFFSENFLKSSKHWTAGH